MRRSSAVGFGRLPSVMSRTASFTSDSMQPTFAVGEAASDEARLAALRLRYEVFCEEGGDDRYADHARRVFVDQDDGPHSRLITGLTSGGRVVGTVRFTRLRDWPFIAHEAYHLPLLASVVGMSESELRNTLGRSDRGVVAKEFRGCGLMSLMHYSLEDLAKAGSCAILVGAVALSNTTASSVNQKLGWVEYFRGQTYNGFTGQLIYKDIRSAGDC
jgi:GNAT superfamily N-acetyltransferase